jgi:hypothetical protein
VLGVRGYSLALKPPATDVGGLRPGIGGFLKVLDEVDVLGWGWSL